MKYGKVDDKKYQSELGGLGYKKSHKDFQSDPPRMEKQEIRDRNRIPEEDSRRLPPLGSNQNKRDSRDILLGYAN